MAGADGPTGVPATLELVAGGTADVVLRGLGTAGYRWEALMEGPQGVVEVRLRRGGAGAAGNAQGRAPGNAGATAAGNAGATAPGGGRRIGAAVPETLSVTGLAAGRVVVHLVQRRPWERGTPPRERHRIDVVVR
jgi:hypothetical protein